MIIPFGEWLPDQPRSGNSCITATNVLPTENGYGPFPGLTVASDALASTCLGTYSFRRVNGTREQFAGTETKLYRKNGDAWDDVTPSAGDYSSSSFWRFALYGDRLIATNGEDNPQKFDLSTDTEFSDLSNAPVHRFPIVIRDTLVAVDLQDGSGDEVAFSASNNSESWTVLSGGGSQSFPDGGPVIGGVGGEYGIIFQEDAITRMDFVGGDLRFTFDKIEGAIGCIDARSIVPYKGGAFYLSSEGFQVFNGASSTNISSGRVTEYFQDSVTDNRITNAGVDTRVTDNGDVRIVSVTDQIQGALDPENSCVVWSYPSGPVNKLLVYSYRLDKWTESDSDVTNLHTAFKTTGTHLAGFDSSNQLNLFNNSTALTASISTGDLRLSAEQSTFVSAVRGLVDSAHDVTVGKKTDLADTEVTVTGSSNSNGKVSLRSYGRYHRFQLDPTAAFTEITGVDVEVRAGGTKV